MTKLHSKVASRSRWLAMGAVLALGAGCGETQRAGEPANERPVDADVTVALPLPESVPAAAEPTVAASLASAASQSERPAPVAEPSTVARPAPSAPIDLTPDTFVEQTERGIVLVDFWASWCGWCTRQAPILEKLAPEYAGKVVIGKVDTDEHPQLAERFGVRGLPTLVLLKDGRRIATFEGFRPEEYLRRAFNTALAGE